MIAKGAAANYRSFGARGRAKPQANFIIKRRIEARLRGARVTELAADLSKLPRLCRLVKSFCPSAVDWIAKTT